MIVINFIYTLVGTPLGYVMWLLYLLVNNFGWAVILFTLVFKLASFPLNLKQQRNMAVSQLFAPRVQEIQRKYRNNQTKMQEEMAKLQKEGYNPMGGCGSMILTFVLLFGVIDVVYKPMTHLERFEWEQKGSIDIVKQVAKQTEYTSIILASESDAELVLEFIKDTGNIYISDSRAKNTLPADFQYTPKEKITSTEREQYGVYIEQNIGAFTGGTSRLSDTIIAELKKVEVKSAGLQSELHAVQSYAKSPDAFNTPMLTPETQAKLATLQDNMIFAGLDLGRTPTFSMDPIIIVPIISFLLSFAQMIVTQIIQKKTMPEMANQQGQGGMKAMMYIMPFFSLWITFTVPAGAGFYWGISYLFGIAQSLIMYKWFPNEKLREQAIEKMKEKNPKFNATATVTDVDDEGNEIEKVTKVSEMSGKGQKEYYKKKLEEARLEDLRKYGDVPEEIDAVSEKILDKDKEKEKEFDTENDIKIDDSEKTEKNKKNK